MRKSRLTIMLATIRSTYQKIPFNFRWPFFPIKIAYRLIGKFRINIWIIKGEDSLKRKLSIIYAGSEKHKNYLANLVFGDIYSEIIIGKWLWNIFKITKRESSACSLIVLEINKTFKRLFDNKKCFLIPCWIAGEIDISIDTASLRKSSTHKGVLRKIKKHNFQFDVTNEEYQFDNFYHSMYLPYITKTYGDQAILIQYNEMKKQLKNCDLLLIKKDQEYIGGAILVYGKNVPRIWSIGIKDGNNDYLKAGISGALDYFSMIYLKQKGYKKMNYGLSRAFLKDGALQYKKNRGLQVVDSTENGFLIKPLSSSIVTKEFFINNPFIYIDQDGLTEAIFLENDRSYSEKNLKRLYKKYNLKGISNFDVYLFGDNIKNIENNAPTELSGRMTFRSAESLF